MPTRYQAVQQTLAAKPQTWLVTGGAGFIGSHLTEKLLLLGQRVRVLDNYFTGKAANLDAVLKSVSPEASGRLEAMDGDIRDERACAAAMAGVDRVVHLAAMGSVPLSLEKPAECHAINVTGTLNLMLAARDAGIRRFVYASSSALYGDDPRPLKQEAFIGKPLSPYAASKHMNEIYAGTACTCYGLEAVGLRFFNVFGPRQDPKGAYAAVIPCWIAAMQTGDPVYINGDGKNTRDFCYVKDVAQALVLASTTDNAGAFGNAFNVGLGAATDLNQLFATIRALVEEKSGRKIADVLYRDFRPGDIRHSCADTSRVGEVLGFEPEYSVMAGLREMCAD